MSVLLGPPRAVTVLFWQVARICHPAAEMGIPVWRLMHAFAIVTELRVLAVSQHGGAMWCFEASILLTDSTMLRDCSATVSVRGALFLGMCPPLLAGWLCVRSQSHPKIGCEGVFFLRARVRMCLVGFRLLCVGRAGAV